MCENEECQVATYEQCQECKSDKSARVMRAGARANPIDSRVYARLTYHVFPSFRDSVRSLIARRMVRTECPAS